MIDFASRLAEELAPVGLELTPDQIRLLTHHYSLLHKWNQRMNLSGIRDPEEIIRLHYCESLYFARWLNLAPGGRVLDVGSGAGFPGIPMAILQPDLSITLLESNQRKSVFLTDATRDLPNVRVLASRLENVSERWETIVTRAVRPLEILVHVPNVAETIALLLGEKNITLVQRSGLCWSTPARIPWGQNRFGLIGRCST